MEENKQIKSKKSILPLLKKVKRKHQKVSETALSRSRMQKVPETLWIYVNETDDCTWVLDQFMNSIQVSRDKWSELEKIRHSMTDRKNSHSQTPNGRYYHWGRGKSSKKIISNSAISDWRSPKHRVWSSWNKEEVIWSIKLAKAVSLKKSAMVNAAVKHKKRHRIKKGSPEQWVSK